MSKTLKVVFLNSLAFIFFAATALTAPTKPSVPSGVPWNLGNINTTSLGMTNPAARMAAQPYAYPTNRWWGAAYIDNVHSAYSLMMSLGTTYIKFVKDGNNAGYHLSAPNPGLRGADVAAVNPETGILRLYVSSDPNLRSFNAAPLKVTSYSDWAVTAEIQNIANSAKMTTTFVKGGVFTYSTFAPGAYPYLSLWPAWSNIAHNAGDGGIISQGSAGQEQWFAIYAPPGTTFSVPDDWGYRLGINFPAGTDTEGDRYIVVAYLGSKANYPNVSDIMPVYNEYRKYAYNFITGTEVKWDKNSDSSITTTFKYMMVPKRTGVGFEDKKTLFALYPHQWKNIESGIRNAVAPEYTTLRGKLKVYEGESFQTRYEFYGVLPNLTYEVPEANRFRLENYMTNDNNFVITTVKGPSGIQDTYYAGKALAKAANLIPIFHQAGKMTERNAMIKQLKDELEAWYKGLAGKSFKYDSAWGGIIGDPYDFGTEIYNDHHFHYGYFIYASAILAIYEPEFALTSQYKGIVDLLIRDFANPDRNNQSFPFLRNFDVYAGHSWSNGKGSSDAGDDGNDQESISEAMNAWAGIYLWGVMTNNSEWIKLGMYGYTTESRAAEEYYFDPRDEIYGPLGYSRRGGILYDNALKYRVHWEWAGPTAQEKYGIWILPLTPSMLYMGYETFDAKKYYDKMTAETPTSMWKDIWLRYKSLFNAADALSDFIAGGFSAEEGSSMSYSYHFINFFNEYGKVNTSFTSDSPFFTAMTKGSQNTFFAFNNSTSSYKKIKIYPSGKEIEVPPMTTAVIDNDYKISKYDSLAAMHQNGNWYALALSKYSDKVSVSSFSAPSSNPDFAYLSPAFEIKAANTNISNTALYVDCTDLSFSTGTVSDIKLAYYDDSLGVTGFPVIETLTIKSSGINTANLRIKTQINKLITLIQALHTLREHHGSR